MIAQMTYLQIITYFILYSALGWMVEVIYQALAKGIVVNRGFLNGPVCPIYGFGVVGIFITTTFIFGDNISSVNFFAVFLCGMVIATVIEFLGGWVLDRCFHARWWDYREKPFNLHGYICLEFSVIWGLGIVLVVREIQPLVRHLLMPFLKWEMSSWIVAAICLLYLADFVVSVSIMIGLNQRFAELNELQQRMRVVSNELSTRIGNEALEKAQKMDQFKLQTSLAKSELRDSLGDNRIELEDLIREMEERKHLFEAKKEEFYMAYLQRKHFGFGRVMRAFPEMRHRDYGELLQELRNQINLRG